MVDLVLHLNWTFRLLGELSYICERIMYCRAELFRFVVRLEIPGFGAARCPFTCSHRYRPEMTTPQPQDQSPIFVQTDAGDRVGLTWDKLDETREIDHVRDSSAGAICSFVGTTRDTFQGSFNHRRAALHVYEATVR